MHDRAMEPLPFWSSQACGLPCFPPLSPNSTIIPFHYHRKTTILPLSRPAHDFHGELPTNLATELPIQTSDGHLQQILTPGSLKKTVLHLGPHADFATFATLLQLCTTHKASPEGEIVHGHLTRRGYGDNTFLNNLLVQMYGTCGSLQHALAVFDNMVCRNSYSWNTMLAACAQNGSLDDARAVFAGMPHRNVVSWNAMITACTRNGHGKEALQLFGEMQFQGFEPNKITFICVMDGCASLAALEVGRDIHALVVGNGLESDAVIETALINMYGRCESLHDARTVFAQMPVWDVVSWNAMITECVHNGCGKQALQLFGQMQAKGFEPNRITFMCVLDACASVAALKDGQEIHTSVVGHGWESDAMGTTLINMYGKCGSLDDARAVFAEMPQQDVVSWNALIAVYVQNGHGHEALELFDHMQTEGFEPNKITCICVLDACASVAAIEEGRKLHSRVVGNGWDCDVIVGNALIDMYGKCKNLNEAVAVFADMPQQDVALWSGMMTAYAQNGQSKEALQLFSQMQAEGFNPNKVTFICILDACASMAALENGREIHACIVGNGWECDAVVRNAIIDMYGKCGSVDDARAVFVEMQEQNVISWTTMIAVCAQNGLGKEAIELFGQMQAKSIQPDKITFICVLTACSHMGLVAEGRQCFTTMSQDHGISPSVDHYVCMIDLLGRAGQLDKAEHMINSMPFEPVPSAWLSFLSSCRIHGDVEREVRAANQVFDVDEKYGSSYVLLATSCCSRYVG